MKNFKKVLALVLVVAMVMAFATVSSAAFTDAASINKAEAVDVLSALGVINGYEDGSFKPEGTVTRAEMAKMIATILNQGEDVGAMYAGACTFADTANHWAAGYVAYCAQEQIINGKNASTFAPDATVTGTEAAKMVLGALGHDADKPGLIGSAWASTTLSLAKKANLIGELNNLTMNMGEAMTRENAAQLLLNGLKATMVEYQGGTNITIGNVVLNQGATPNNVAQTVAVDFAGRTDEDVAVAGNQTYQQLAEECFPNKLKVVAGGYDAYGRTCNVWTYENETIGSYNVAPYIIYTTEVTLGQLYTDLGKVDSTKLVGGISAALNGSADTATAAKLANIKSGNITDKIGAQGTQTEVYFDPITMTLNVAQIDVFAGKIQSVVPAVKDANGDIAKEAYVVITPLYGATPATVGVTLLDGTYVATPNTVITDAFTLADREAVVYYSIGECVDGVHSGKQIQEVAKATAITGTNAGYAAVTGVGTVSTTIDATTYMINKTAQAAGKYGATYGQPETIYVDANNNVVYTTGVTSTDFLYVLGNAKTTNFSEDYSANVVLHDGTVKIVDLAPIHRGGNGVANQTIYNYTVDATGKYTLVAPAGATGTLTTVTNKVPTVNGKTADVNTKFVVGTVDATTQATTYTVYTGIAAVPSFSLTDTITTDAYTPAAKYACDPITGNIAVIFAEDTQGTGTATTSVMALYKTGEEAKLVAGVGNEYYSVAAVVDGKVTTVKVAPIAYTAMTANEFKLVSGGMQDSFGNYTSLTDVIYAPATYAQANKFTTFAPYENGNVTLGTPKYVEASTPVVVWNMTARALQVTTVEGVYAMTAATTGSYTTEVSTISGVEGAITGIYMTVDY